VALGYEWELIVLILLSRIGHVDYEPDLGQDRRPDVVFEANCNPALRFIADVTTVSDIGLEEDNPVLELSAFLREKASKLGILGGFSYDVRGATDDGPYNDRKMRLLLPSRPRLREFLEQHVTPELKRIVREKLQTHQINIEQPPKVSFTLGYSASSKHWSGHYPSYVATYSVVRNPVYASLKKKLKQLKEATTNVGEVPLGVILCDGNCRLLQPDNLGGVGAINLEQVISLFFKRNKSISFVLVLTFPPARAQAFGSIQQDKAIVGRLYTNSTARIAIDPEPMLAILNESLRTMPRPVASASGALAWMERPTSKHTGRPFGSLSWSGGIMNETVKVSARLVLDMLAGKITAAEFAEHLGQPGQPDWAANPFVRAQRTGQLIKNITVTHVDHEDDDWLEIEFGPPDPAVTRFRID
jgi:hypothetical protein